MPKTNRFRRTFLALGALALAMLAAGTLWLRLGWRAVDVTLEDLAGDPAALRGFTLNGRINWNHLTDSLHFSLHDGYLDTAMVFGDEEAPFLNRPIVNTDQTYAIATAERAGADRGASEVPQFSAGPRTLQTVATRLDRMYTLKVQFPGAEERYVRISAGEYTLEDPVMVESWVTDHPYELDNRYDYTWTEPDDDARASWPDTVVDQRPFALDGVPVVCWEQDYLGRAPGLYRIYGLTTDEIAALPRDGTRGGEEILCGSTEFGTLEPFYCPDDAVHALTGAAMADGYSLLLYLDADNTVWADLVDGDGNRTDHRQVTSLPASDVYGAEVKVRTTDRDAVVSLYSTDLGPAVTEDRTSKLAALRAEDGQFTIVHCEDQDPANTATAAVLNAEGNALLLGWYHYTSLPAPDVGTPPDDGILLEVRPLTGGTRYQGLLHTGTERDWGQYYDGYSYQQKTRYLTFDPLEGGSLA